VDAVELGAHLHEALRLGHQPTPLQEGVQVLEHGAERLVPLLHAAQAADLPDQPEPRVGVHGGDVALVRLQGFALAIQHEDALVASGGQVRHHPRRLARVIVHHRQRFPRTRRGVAGQRLDGAELLVGRRDVLGHGSAGKDVRWRAGRGENYVEEGARPQGSGRR
jgi:hypothetical protein